MSLFKLGILGSTRGSNLIPLTQALQKKALPFEISLVLSNRKDAAILERARDQGWPNLALPNQGRNREAHDAQLTSHLKSHSVDCVVLMGYMRILSPTFVAAWRRRILNVHPSLLPDFAGLMNGAVHQAVLDAKRNETGCTVHEVDETIDGGPILVQKTCPVLPNDTVDTLKTRVQRLEVTALADAIHTLYLTRTRYD